MDNENLRRLSRLATGRRFWVLAAAHLCRRAGDRSGQQKTGSNRPRHFDEKQRRSRARVEREAAIRASAAAFVKAFALATPRQLPICGFPTGRWLTTKDD